MATQSSVVTVQPKKTEVTFSDNAKKALFVGGVTALASMNASAAEIDTIGASLNTELDAVKALVVGLFTLGAVLIGLFAGYKYLKRGGNSA